MPRMTTQCQCPIAGYCTTHGRRMSETRHHQCHDEPGYYEAFAKGRERAPAFIGPPRPGKPCTGCNKRKKIANKIIPGLGNAIEAFTEVTGIKAWWEERSVNQ